MSVDCFYAQYILERQGFESFWREHGFISYKVTGTECFLADMFVEAGARKTGKGRKLLEELIGIARYRGCNVITANIYLFDPNANNTLLAAMACGFRVEKCGNNVLLIAMELKE